MTAGYEYGKALFLLSDEEGTLEETKRDLETVLLILNENPDYIKLIYTPAIPKEERIALIDEAFAPICESARNLMKILSQKRMFFAFREVISAFISLYNEKMGIISCEAVTAIPLSDTQAAAIAKKLSDMTDKKVIVKNTVDPEILGGIKLRYLGTQIDGSIKTRLDGFAEGLKNIVI